MSNRQRSMLMGGYVSQKELYCCNGNQYSTLGPNFNTNWHSVINIGTQAAPSERHNQHVTPKDLLLALPTCRPIADWRGSTSAQTARCSRAQRVASSKRASVHVSMGSGAGAL